MNIKIEIPAISELATAIYALASSLYESSKLQAGNAAQQETAATVEEAAEVEPIKEKPAAKQANEAKAIADTTPNITLETVRAKLAALTQSGKQAEVKALIQKYGGAKLSDIPEDKYPELMKEAEGI